MELLVTLTSIMLIRYFVILLILSVSFAEESINSNLLHNDYEGIIHEESSIENQILVALNQLNTEMHLKFDAMDKKYLENLEALNHKLNELEKKIPDNLDELLEEKFNILRKKIYGMEEKMEDNLNELHHQENKILNKLEDYIDLKINSSEKHIYRKIDKLEMITADKTDVKKILHKLDGLEKYHPDSYGSLFSEMKPSENMKLQNTTEEIDQKFNLIANTNSQLVNTSSQYKPKTQDSHEIILKESFDSLKKHISLKLDELQAILSNKTDNLMIKNILRALENNQCDLNIKETSETINETLKTINQNLNQKMSQIEMKISIVQKDTSNFNFDELKRNIQEIKRMEDSNANKLLKVAKTQDTEGLREAMGIYFESTTNIMKLYFETLSSQITGLRR